MKRIVGMKSAPREVLQPAYCSGLVVTFQSGAWWHSYDIGGFSHVADYRPIDWTEEMGPSYRGLYACHGCGHLAVPLFAEGEILRHWGEIVRLVVEDPDFDDETYDEPSDIYAFVEALMNREAEEDHP